jgi:outer membrane receptor protein involved in Fe transport
MNTLREAKATTRAGVWLGVSAWILVFALPLARAQGRSLPRISGVVTDTTGAAIAGASVAFSAGVTHLTQVTNGNGEFSFADVPSESGVLHFSAPGFLAKDVLWRASENSVEAVLAPAGPAERVTVTANRTSTRVIETPTSIVILGPRDLAATTALTTDDALQQAPGFSLFRRIDSRTANPTTQGVSLRGLGASGASRALVLADGFPLNDPFGGWVYWARVPREEIASMEVASGGASHLYGSDALGGVINILRKPVAQSAFSLEAAGGNENTPDLSLAGSRRMGQWAGAISGDIFRTDGYISVPTDLRGTVDTPVASEHASGDATVQRSFADHGDIFARGSLFGESRKNGTPLQTNSTTVRELDLGADWSDQQFGFFKLRAYASRQGLDQSFSSIAADRNSESLTRTQDVPAQNVGFSVQWMKSLGTRQNLVAGFDQRDVHGQTDELGYSNGAVTSAANSGGREVNWGGYGEDIVRITSRLLLTASGRVDHWQNFDAFFANVPVANRRETFFSPRLALLRKLNKHVSLTASGYRSFRAPTLNEFYRSFRAGNVVTQANPNLLAERLTGWEAGMIISEWAQRFLLRSNFYWADINRPIANVTISQTPSLITRQRQNLGGTRSRGVEVEVSARLSDSISISTGYEYTDATVTSFPANPALNIPLVGLNIPQVPRNKLTFQANYTKPFILVGVQGRFVGNAFDDDQNTLLLRRFFTMDVIASHALRRGFEVFAAAENVFDQRYDVARSPVLSVGPPILVRAGVRLRFGNGL